jgi:hypothetical protein
LLFQDPAKSSPHVVGQVDESELGSHLRRQLLESSLQNLIATGAALDVLGTDGLTTFDLEGQILGSGEIIDTSTAGLVVGGGRTHAAAAASHAGLVLKVSEDGPISAYQDGVRLVELAT